jgi:hypothetical protein
LWFFREKTEIAIDDSGEAYQNQQRGGKKSHDKLKGIVQLEGVRHYVDAVNQQNCGGNQNSNIFKPDEMCCHDIL